jgi:hypothetical protein
MEGATMKFTPAEKDLLVDALREAAHAREHGSSTAQAYAREMEALARRIETANDVDPDERHVMPREELRFVAQWYTSGPDGKLVPIERPVGLPTATAASGKKDPNG